jgi:hypothetical protein
VLTVAPGATFYATYDWQIHNEHNFCPGCIQQVAVGWTTPGYVAPCFSVGRGFPGNSGVNRAVTLTAPSTPGTYYISTRSAHMYNCADMAEKAGFATGSHYVAAICVK